MQSLTPLIDLGVLEIRIRRIIVIGVKQSDASNRNDANAGKVCDNI